MAEVANLPSQAPPTSTEHSAASVVAVASAALPADIPNNENLKNEINDLSSAAQLGTSPNQEKSSNSHHHDSEYDTASDLEGGTHDDYEDDDDNDEEGDEEDDDDDDSVEEVGNSDTDSVEFDAERQRGDGQEQADYTKKVDEDRSNPQYIPKKGTFYEHDDRTADEPEVQASQVTETSEAGGENKSASPTTISQASKTMKKWQPASGVDRWSHDRFVAGEQAPKSRTELVSAYGYDIRDEDGPPRARRRRRYARGPSKYSRNWEDETAYIKASNAQRKPPRPEDFPALEERQKARKSRSYRDEKENRFDRQQTDRNRVAAAGGGGGGGGGQQIPNRENKEPIRRSTGNPKHVRSGGRQHGMEFKNKNRSNNSGHMNSNRGNNNIDRDGVNITRSIVNNQAIEQSSIVESSNFQKISSNPNNKSMNMQQTVKVINQQPFNGYEQQQGQAMHKSQQQQVNNASASGYNPRDINDKFTNNHSNQSPRPVTAPTSNLSARLQQAQNRNDPSHVGSVQMHTLANQHSPQVPNQNVMQNAMVEIQHQQQQQQQQMQQVVNQQEQARSKRYSSLRQRTQHDTAGSVPSNPHLDQHTLQQLQMQHEVQQQQQQQQHQQQISSNVHPPPQQLMMQEQQLIQANLMQLYHQENLQAQMQALQVSSLPPAAAPQPPAAPKQPYATLPQQYAAGSSGPPAATYYAASTPDYSTPPPAAVPPQQLQYTPQPTAFMQSQSAAAPLAFNPTATQQPISQNAMAPPIAASAPAQVPPGSVNYVQAAPPNPATAPSAAYPNYTNYTPNFNTVGGTTYFVPTPQPTARPTALPQRRPTNAIPILPPSEKKRTGETKQEEDSKTNSSTASATSANAPIGSAENIDHILDNMFVQRAPYQPQTRKSASPPSDDPNKGSNTNSTTAAAAAGVADPSSVGKSRTHESSAVECISVGQ
ncbi:bromodomain-containing protein DDB_G0280777 isoform X2 [Episyrphus balteatus]|uniref:bromodomain-containing protein DDB_G0280777 isoform X2 n=1 Tax=Episyrphus balteatus TaxID=286459 RepID=UPI002486B0B4|nr:bromodomain-containing protein DDB_G0280777 isoform X2 [Episyrphus balteatus]